MPRLSPSLVLAAALAVLAVLAAGCDRDRGDASFGAACAEDDECAEGLCVGGVDGDAPKCTRSCASAEECPEGWSCSGVTDNQVLVCQRGSATPFGD